MENSTGKALIKEIAAELGLSVGTVSIVLNGRGDKMRISQKTQKRVKELAKERGYHPNIYARRLRNAAAEDYEHVVAIFWNYEYGDDIISDFLKGLQTAVDEKGRVVAFNIHMFENGHLSECENLMTSSRYSAIVVCGLSACDMEFLSAKSFDLPVISVFTNSSRFSSVYVDNFSVGISVANMFYEKGVRAAGYIGSAEGKTNSILRKKGFLTQLENLGIKTCKEWVFEGEKRYVDCGMEAMQSIMASDEIPQAIFINVPEYAVGAMIECDHKGINVGEDIYILAAGTSRTFRNYKNKIATIATPVEAMAEETINVLFETLESDSETVRSKILKANYKEGATI